MSRVALPIAGENLFPHTDLANATYWNANSCAVTANAGVAPDGTNTAYLVTDAVSGAVSHRVEWSGVGGVIPATNAVQCFSCYFKVGTLNKFALRAVSNGWSNTFDFSTTPPTIIDGSILTGSPLAAYDWWLSNGIQDVGNGWYRCWTSYRAGVAGQGPFVGNVNTSQRFLVLNGATSYTGTGTGTCYLWGPQINNGVLPTKYTPNTSGAATGAPQRQPTSLPNVVTSRPSVNIASSRIVSPFDVAETVAWFSGGAQVTPASGAASAWGNTSNVYSATQSAPSQRPTITNDLFGRPTLTFASGSAQELTNSTQNPVAAGNARYVLVVGRSLTTACGAIFQFRLANGGRVWRCILGVITTNFYYFTDGISNNVTDQNVLVNGVSAAPDITQPFICEWELTAGATPVIRFNGVQRTLAGSVNATPEAGTTGFRIGGADVAGQYWNGTLSDIYIASGIPSPAQCAGLREFFTSRMSVRNNDDAPLQLSIAPSVLCDAADYNPSEGVAVDRSGNARHATPQSAIRPTRGNGIAGRATIKFPGSANQALVVPATSFGPFSIWLVARCSGSVGTLVVTGSSSAANGGYLYASVGSTIHAVRASVASQKNLASNWALDGIARSLIWTFDGSHAGHKLYIGGTLQTLTNGGLTSDPGTTPLSQAVYIGATDSGASPIAMEVAGFGLYPGVLTATDIATLSAHSLQKFGV